MAEDSTRSVDENLRALLGATCLDTLVDLGRFPQVRRSILNFGIPCFAGHTPGSLARSGFESRVRDAVAAFEPRVAAETVRVVLHVADAKYGAVPLSVEARLREGSHQLRLTVDLDLELGTARSWGP